MEIFDERRWFGRTNIVPRPRIFGLHSKRMSNKQGYYGHLQKYVRIHDFCKGFGKTVFSSESVGLLSTLLCDTYTSSEVHMREKLFQCRRNHRIKHIEVKVIWSHSNRSWCHKFVFLILQSQLHWSNAWWSEETLNLHTLQSWSWFFPLWNSIESWNFPRCISEIWSLGSSIIPLWD